MATRLLIPLFVLGFAVLLVVQLARNLRAEAAVPQVAMPALTNVYRASGTGQSLRYSTKGTAAQADEITTDERIVIRVDAFGPRGSGTGMTTKGGCAAFYMYEGGRIYFEGGATLDLTDMTLEGWSGQPPAFVSGKPAKGA